MKNKFKVDLQLFAESREKQIEKRLAEIRESLTKGEGDVDELEQEIKDLQEERKEIKDREKRQKIADSINVGAIEGRNIEKPADELPELNEREERGKDLKEDRAVTVGTSDVILPQHSASDIRPTFNEVSSLIDRVQHKPLNGGESFKQPYLITYGEGDYTEEGQDYHETEPKFGYAPIVKTKITAYSETTEEIEKLPDADYESEVMGGISIATRKKITRQIIIGDGSTDHIVGIFSDKAEAIDPETDKIISKIDETTLDDIIYSFGGDEDVEDVAVLILNKNDLREFAMLRTKDGKKVYDVKNNGNTGTIDTVPYIINSACSSIVNGKIGDYCMAYGPLSNYMLATFSQLEVMKSLDYKFKQGMIAHKGSTFAGGNVVSYNGFLRIKKGEAGGTGE